MLYQAYLANHIKISVEFKQNLRKSYKTVWELCNKQLQTFINTDVHYETKIQDNTVKLFKFINILMHEPERLKYMIASIHESIKHLVNTEQKDNETILDHLKCLKQDT